MALFRRLRAAIVVGVLAIAAVFFIRLAFFAPEGIPPGAICVPRDAATLAVALDRVSPGDTIVLGAGSSWAGPIDVSVPSITIRSAGKPARITAEGGAPALTLRADGVRLVGLELAGDGLGLLVSSADCRVERLTVRGTTTAIRMVGARGTQLRDIDIEGAAVGIEVVSCGGSDIRGAAIRRIGATALRHSGSWDTVARGLKISDSTIGVAVEEGSRDVRLADFLVLDSADTAVIVRSSTGVVLQGGTVRRAETGVRLERATACELHDLSVADTATGVFFLQSLQNAVRACTIRSARDSAIRVEDSDENSCVDNVIQDARIAAISVDSSDRMLIESNAIRDAEIGLRIEDSAATLALRNEIAVAATGILALRTPDARILRNRTTGGAIGICVISAPNAAAMENHADRHTIAAFAILAESPGASMQQNTATRSTIGVVIDTGVPVSVLDGHVAQNDVGILAVRPIGATRLEGNRLEGNDVGLRVTESSDGLPAEWAALSLDALRPSAAGGLVIAHNLFRGSRRLDIENLTPSVLHAAGNRWGGRASRTGDGARVTDGVSLTSSAWKGSLAVGAGISPVDDMLGAIVRILLADAGYHVLDLVGLGDETRVRSAIESGDLAVSVGRWLEPIQGCVDFALPARAGWAVLISPERAARLPEKTLSALAQEVQSQPAVLLAAPDTLDDDAIARLRSAYTLTDSVRAVVRTASIEEAESLLTLGTAQIAILPALEETRTSSGYVALVDDRGALPSSALAATARRATIDAHPDLPSILSRVTPYLTSTAVHGLIEEARLLRRSAADVAGAFLARMGLLALDSEE